MAPINPPKRNIIANVDRLHRLMDASGLDAVAVRTGVNFTISPASRCREHWRVISISPARFAASC